LHPRLAGLTKEEAEAHPGSYLSSFFARNSSRFHFSPSEQRLLQHALTGETCQDLAISLALSLWTVKKRWHAIYDRVTETQNVAAGC
jgi:DNA-binding CsgD family transcriptional regulator